LATYKKRLRLVESKVAKKEKNLKIKSQRRKTKKRRRKMIKKRRSQGRRMMVWVNLRNSSLAKRVSRDPRLSSSLPNS
jgi:hypothetical protein